MCHPPDWSMCLLPVFVHMETDHVVERLGTPQGKDLIGSIGSQNSKGPKVIVHIDH
jgi:hypothetical protein